MDASDGSQIIKPWSLTASRCTRLATWALLAGAVCVSLSLLRTDGTALQHAGRVSKTHHTEDSFCSTSEYRKNALKLVKEAPFVGLFGDLRNQSKFEASDLAYDARSESFLVVFDSSMSLGRIDETFSFRGRGNELVGERGRESQFEGISPYDPEGGLWLLLAESVPGTDSYKGNFYPEISMARVHGHGYDVIEKCLIDFPLTHENKGFESILYLPEKDILLGLCEGNYCVGGKKGKERGNGKIVASRLSREKEHCVWKTVDVIDIPKAASFKDYSGMAIHRNMRKMAVLSQEDSAVYVADFDLELLRFRGTNGVVLQLPRDSECRIKYCNAEGIAFMDEYRLMIVSDKAKSRQPFECLQNDQSVGIFAVPDEFVPYTTSQVS
jgi:uncharacterized protein YjiK